MWAKVARTNISLRKLRKKDAQKLKNKKIRGLHNAKFKAFGDDRLAIPEFAFFGFDLVQKLC